VGKHHWEVEVLSESRGGIAGIGCYILISYIYWC
jgi:hypothetical protein